MINSLFFNISKLVLISELVDVNVGNKLRRQLFDDNQLNGTIRMMPSVNVRFVSLQCNVQSSNRIAIIRESSIIVGNNIDYITCA